MSLVAIPGEEIISLTLRSNFSTWHGSYHKDNWLVLCKGSQAGLFERMSLSYGSQLSKLVTGFLITCED